MITAAQKATARQAFEDLGIGENDKATAVPRDDVPLPDRYPESADGERDDEAAAAQQQVAQPNFTTITPASSRCRAGRRPGFPTRRSSVGWHVVAFLPAI